MRLVLCATCLFASAAASAQGAFDMGMLTNTISQGAVSGGGGGHKVRKTHRRPLAKPSIVLFTPSQAVRKRATEAVVAQYEKSDPNFARALRQELAKPASWTEMEREVRKLGLNPRSVTDGMAVYLVQSWYGARGRVAKSPAEYRAVGRQFALAMRGVPAAARMSDALKQETAESLMLQGAILESFVKRAQRRKSELPVVKAGAVRGAQAMFGFDVTKLKLGANGLY